MDEQAALSLIQALRHVGDEPWVIPLCDPPSGVERQLDRLVLQHSQHFVSVEIGERELRITGGLESLAKLADELNRFISYNDLNEPGMHTHIDRNWHPVPEWVIVSSLPLTIAGWVAA
jgi:hypothetical protein